MKQIEHGRYTAETPYSAAKKALIAILLFHSLGMAMLFIALWKEEIGVAYLFWLLLFAGLPVGVFISFAAIKAAYTGNHWHIREALEITVGVIAFAIMLSVGGVAIWALFA